MVQREKSENGDEAINKLLRQGYQSQITSYYESIEAPFRKTNFNHIKLLNENEAIIEYVDSASCELAIQIFKDLTIKGRPISIRHGFEKPKSYIHLKITGLNKTFINEEFLGESFIAFLPRIIKITLHHNVNELINLDLILLFNPQRSENS